jgi:hypothetical protein
MTLSMGAYSGSFFYQLIRCSVRRAIRGSCRCGEFRFVEDADQPAAVLLSQGGDHQAFAGWTFPAVGCLRSGDHRIRVYSGRFAA